MDNPTDQATVVDVAGDGDLLRTGRPRVRRRLVQSTLFPHRSQENAAGKEDEDCDQEDDSEEEDYCGSQGKKKRKRKPRASKKPLKRQVNSTPKKKQAQTTPKKYRINGGLKEAYPEQISDSPIESGNVAQSIPDLRLEERLKAEENARIFGGRQMHPFFSSWKMAKNCQVTTAMEKNLCSVECEDKSATLSPIHVFEKFQDNVGSLDWGNWVFSERSFISSNCDLETVCSPVFEGSVNSLHFDDISDLYPCEAIQHEGYSHAIWIKSSADKPTEAYEPVKDVEVGHEMESTDILSGHAGHIRNSEFEWEGRFLDER
ncbi:hypothetical protein U1Q18_037095 [Sarracenia purpurea var. burkii]